MKISEFIKFLSDVRKDMGDHDFVIDSGDGKLQIITGLFAGPAVPKGPDNKNPNKMIALKFEYLNKPYTIDTGPRIHLAK